MGHLPALDLNLRANLDPHVFIFGAGASRQQLHAATALAE
jgi:hypothetical protein